MPEQVIVVASDSTSDAGECSVGEGTPLFVSVVEGSAKVLAGGMESVSAQWNLAVVHPRNAAEVIQNRGAHENLHWMWHFAKDPPIIAGIRAPRHFHHMPDCPEWVNLERVLVKIEYGHATGDVSVKKEWSELVGCLLCARLANEGVLFLNWWQEQLWLAEANRTENVQIARVADVANKLEPLQSAMNTLVSEGVPSTLENEVDALEIQWGAMLAWNGDVGAGYKLTRSLRDSLFGSDDGSISGLVHSLLSHGR